MRPLPLTMAQTQTKEKAGVPEPLPDKAAD
jgi:hypothetical protein